VPDPDWHVERSYDSLATRTSRCSLRRIPAMSWISIASFWFGALSLAPTTRSYAHAHVANEAIYEDGRDPQH